MPSTRIMHESDRSGMAWLKIEYIICMNIIILMNIEYLQLHMFALFSFNSVHSHDVKCRLTSVPSGTHGATPRIGETWTSLRQKKREESSILVCKSHQTCNFVKTAEVDKSCLEIAIIWMRSKWCLALWVQSQGTSFFPFFSLASHGSNVLQVGDSTKLWCHCRCKACTG